MAAPEPIEFAVVHRLGERGLRIGVAESCTGGLIGHLLTNVPGSSRCFIGGVAAYHGSAKTVLLGVPRETLQTHGGVSAETAMAMAEGVRERLGADIGIGVTGIAGPTGGGGEKPVGLVYMALAAGDGRTLARREVFPEGREQYKVQTARAALELVEQYLNT